MNAGELFVKIGVQGADKAAKEVSGLGRALTDVSARGLAAKAAVLGVVYGVTSLVSGTARAGQSVYNFGVYTGKSIEQLEKWKISMMKGGVSADEFQGQAESLFRVIGGFKFGEFPKSLGYVFNNSGHGQADYHKILNGDLFTMMQVSRDYAKREKHPEVRDRALGELGFSPAMIVGLAQGKDISKISDGEARFSTNSAKAAASMNLQLQKLELAFAKIADEIALDYGPTLLKWVQAATVEFKKLVDWMGALTADFSKIKKEYWDEDPDGKKGDGPASQDPKYKGWSEKDAKMDRFAKKLDPTNMLIASQAYVAELFLKTFIAPLIAHASGGNPVGKALAGKTAFKSEWFMGDMTKFLTPNPPAGGRSHAGPPGQSVQQTYQINTYGVDQKDMPGKIHQSVKDAGRDALARGGRKN